MSICFDGPSPLSNPKFDTALSLLIRCLPLLSNLTFLTIELPPNPIPALFRAISTSFIEMLQELTLAGDFHVIAALVEYCAHERPFKSLTELNFHLYWSDTQTISSLSLAPFVLSLAPTLQALRIWSTGRIIDFSPFFNALSEPRSSSPIPFSNLKSVLLNFDFDVSLRSIPQSLHRFLLTHNNNLQNLEIDVHSFDGLDTWLAELVNNNSRFLSLQTLVINPSKTQKGRSAVLTLLKRAASTLSSLTILGPHLTLGNATEMILALTEGEVQIQAAVAATTKTEKEPKKLESLSLNVLCLTVPFLELLAQKLPELKELSLRVLEITGSDKVRICFLCLPS